MASTNNKTSDLIQSQVPFFVRNDHPNFVRFLEAYFEYLEQDTKAIKVAKDDIRVARDIDQTSYEEQLYEQFMKSIPSNVNVDKRLLLKNIKDFYRARGTEKSIKFLMNILFNQQNVNFYYPKKDILRASDGKWYVQRSLRVNDIKINGNLTTSLVDAQFFGSTTVRGNTSGATAIVERVDRFFESGSEINELIITGTTGNFKNGEQVFSLFDNEGTTKSITANIYSGIINTITINNPGSRYNVGDHPIITSNTGTGGDIIITQVTSGNIPSITVIEGGAGYRANDQLLFTGGGTGSGAQANVQIVLSDSSVHPNSYNIVYSTISLEANTPINNTTYSNLNSSITDPANNQIMNLMSFFTYSNTGPAKTIIITNPGSNYSEKPTIQIVANTRIKELGILGRMEIVNGGLGYQLGDTIEFTNVLGGYGYGARANVTNVAANGMIQAVKFVEIPGQIIGGSGYEEGKLPLATVISANGSAYGANIVATHLLGSGGEFIVANTTIGGIQKATILNRGTGYTVPPLIDLTTQGDGQGNITVTVIEGVYEYPGRYLNDDGFLSSYNFLEDRDYYQLFSYEVRIPESTSNYRKPLNELIHPAGTKMFGRYIVEDNAETSNTKLVVENTESYIISTKTYVKTGNTINISYTSHGLSTGNLVALEFLSGGYTNVVNGIYNVSSVGTNYFLVKERKSSVKTINITSGGLGYNANSYLVFSAENGYAANGTYAINANGSIVSVSLTDYGMYYSTSPTVSANGSNSTPATFTVELYHYANNTSGSVNVSKHKLT